PADLQPVSSRADVVGVVDRPGGEPENLFLQLPEQLEFPVRAGSGIDRLQRLGSGHCPPPSMRLDQSEAYPEADGAWLRSVRRIAHLAQQMVRLSGGRERSWPILDWTGSTSGFSTCCRRRRGYPMSTWQRRSGFRLHLA